MTVLSSLAAFPGQLAELAGRHRHQVSISSTHVAGYYTTSPLKDPVNEPRPLPPLLHVESGPAATISPPSSTLRGGPGSEPIAATLDEATTLSVMYLSRPSGGAGYDSFEDTFLIGFGGLTGPFYRLEDNSSHDRGLFASQIWGHELHMQVREGAADGRWHPKPPRRRAGDRSQTLLSHPQIDTQLGLVLWRGPLTRRTIEAYLVSGGASLSLTLYGWDRGLVSSHLVDGVSFYALGDSQG